MIEGSASQKMLEGGARKAAWPVRLAVLVATLVMGLALLATGPRTEVDPSAEPTGTGFGARFDPAEVGAEDRR